MEIGEIIKTSRMHGGITQSSLARSLGVSRTTVSNWEKGRGVPDVSHFRKLLTLLDLNTDEIDEQCRMGYNNRVEKFNPAILNAQGLSKLYEYYCDLIDDDENLK